MARHLPQKTPTLSVRLAEYRRETGMGQVAFAKHLGVPQSSLASWESGKRPISRDTMLKIAGKAQMHERDYWLSQAGIDLAVVDQTVRGFKKTRSHVVGDMLIVPIRTGAIAAGQPISQDENEYEGCIGLPLCDATDTSRYVGLRVKGDSMSPQIKEGYIVVVDARLRSPKDNVGRVVAAVDEEGCATIKTLIETGGAYFLVAANPDFKPQVQPINASHRWLIAGRVVKWIGTP